MTDLDPDEPDAQFHPDRREHAGAPAHLDDDQLARLTEEERVEAGLEDYDPDAVPPASGVPPGPDITRTEVYQEEQAELRRREAEGELSTRGEEDGFPPTRYDDD
jgi:hypothetical protein